MPPMIALLSINILLLTAWTILSRDEDTWEHTITDYDVFGRPTESKGRCYNKGFMIALTALDLFSLVFLVQQGKFSAVDI